MAAQWEDDESGVATHDKRETQLKKPSLYKVIMHNDHYSTMDFVITMLMSVFAKQANEATNIMLDVHKKGAGLCGVYPKDIAETKVHAVHERAKEAGYPLRCSMQKE